MILPSAFVSPLMPEGETMICAPAIGRLVLSVTAPTILPFCWALTTVGIATTIATAMSRVIHDCGMRGSTKWVRLGNEGGGLELRGNVSVCAVLSPGEHPVKATAEAGRCCRA